MDKELENKRKTFLADQKDDDEKSLETISVSAVDGADVVKWLDAARTEGFDEAIKLTKDRDKCSFCPECGSTKNRLLESVQKGHMQCEECSQEWFKDLDYRGAIAANFRARKRAREREKILADLLKDINDEIYLHYPQSSYDGGPPIPSYFEKIKEAQGKLKGGCSG